MIEKPIKIVHPLDERKIFALDSFLTNISKNAGRILTGSYTGDGTTGRVLTIGAYPWFLVISKYANLGTDSFPLAGNMVFSLSSNAGVSYIPGTGFVKDAVLTLTHTGVTLGVNASVNQANTSYIYFAIA